jgi:hypothetical protein
LLSHPNCEMGSNRVWERGKNSKRCMQVLPTCTHSPTEGLNGKYWSPSVGRRGMTGDHASASWQSASRSLAKLFALKRFRLDSHVGRAGGFVFVSKNWQIHSPSAAICSPSAHIDFSSVHFHSPRSQILRLVRFAAWERLHTDRTCDHKAGRRNGIAPLIVDT